MIGNYGVQKKLRELENHKKIIKEETNKNKMMTGMRKKRVMFIQKQTTKSNW